MRIEYVRDAKFMLRWVSFDVDIVKKREMGVLLQVRRRWNVVAFVFLFFSNLRNKI